MLKKVLKYDLKYNYKILFVFYALALFFAFLTRFFLKIDNSLVMNVLGQICGGVTVSMMFNIIINNLMRIWVRFNQNFYGDESYLTHTLPIEKKTLYLSKFLSSIITLFSSIAVIVLSFFIAYGTKDLVNLVGNLLNSFSKSLNTKTYIIIFALIVILFIEFLNALQCGFTGIILGHRRNSSKIGFSIIFGFLIYLASQSFVLIVTLIFALFNDKFMNLFLTKEAVDINTLKAVILIAIISYLIVIIVDFILNLKLFKKGVNVD